MPVKPNADYLFTCFVCFLSVYQAYLMVSCISHDYSSYLIHVPTEELLKVIFFFFFGYSTYCTGRRNNSVMALGTVGLTA